MLNSKPGQQASQGQRSSALQQPHSQSGAHTLGKTVTAGQVDGYGRSNKKLKKHEYAPHFLVKRCLHVCHGNICLVVVPHTLSSRLSIYTYLQACKGCQSSQKNTCIRDLRFHLKLHLEFFPSIKALKKLIFVSWKQESECLLFFFLFKWWC